MTDAIETLAARPIRRDGWTPQRRQLFIELLGAGLDVQRACAKVGLSRQAAYPLRRRDPAFAQAWDGAVRSAQTAEEAAFYALLPEHLLRALSELSGPCKLRGAGGAQDRVRSVAHL